MPSKFITTVWKLSYICIQICLQDTVLIRHHQDFLTSDLFRFIVIVTTFWHSNIAVKT